MMLSDLSVVIQNGTPTINDGTTVHAFADPAALRLFIHTWRVLHQQFPSVEFALNDDATIASWGGPDAQPTPAQIAALITAFRSAETQAAADAQTLRTKVSTLAQSAVGVQLDQLTAAQVRALIAFVLYKQGAIDKTGAIKPLDTWG